MNTINNNDRDNLISDNLSVLKEALKLVDLDITISQDSNITIFQGDKALLTKPLDDFRETVIDGKTKVQYTIPFGFSVTLEDGKQVSYRLRAYNSSQGENNEEKPELQQTIELSENGVTSKVDLTVKNDSIVTMEATIDGDQEYLHKELKLKEDGHTVLIADLSNKDTAPKKEPFSSMDEEQTEAKSNGAFYVNNDIGIFGHFYGENSSTKEYASVELEHRDNAANPDRNGICRYISGDNERKFSVSKEEIDYLAKEGLKHPVNKELIERLARDLGKRFNGIDRIISRFSLYNEVMNSHYVPNEQNAELGETLEIIRGISCDLSLITMNKMLAFVGLEAEIDGSDDKKLRIVRRIKSKANGDDEDKTITVAEFENTSNFLLDLDDGRTVKYTTLSCEDRKQIHLEIGNATNSLKSEELVMYVSKGNQTSGIKARIENGRSELSAEFDVYDLPEKGINACLCRHYSGCRVATIKRLGQHFDFYYKEFNSDSEVLLSLAPIDPSNPLSEYKKTTCNSSTPETTNISYPEALLLFNKALSSKRVKETIDCAKSVIDLSSLNYFDFVASEGLPDYTDIIKTYAEPDPKEIDGLTLPSCNLTKSERNMLSKIMN